MFAKMLRTSTGKQWRSFLLRKWKKCFLDIQPTLQSLQGTDFGFSKTQRAGRKKRKAFSVVRFYEKLLKNIFGELELFEWNWLYLLSFVLLWSLSLQFLVILLTFSHSGDEFLVLSESSLVINWKFLILKTFVVCSLWPLTANSAEGP